MKYDYLIVGTGLFGAVFAHEMKAAGKTCYCIDKRTNIAGNIYTEENNGIQVHKYGAHIFHTSNQKVWDYVNQFAEFNHYINSPVAIYGEELYNMPFNMNTFSKMWNIKTPKEAKKIIDAQRADCQVEEPANLEEQALSLVGRDVYEKLVKGYTEKQWGRDCTELPAFIIKRLPVRFTYDNNYFTDRYQGIPVGGYTQIVEKLLEGIPLQLGVEYRDFLAQNAAKAEQDTFEKVLYTGMIDEYFNYQLGELQYRSLRFEEEELPDCDNYQGNAVVNYTERKIPYTRIIEHKHFEFGKGEGTIITREYPVTWQKGDEPYYPINDERNNKLFAEYQQLAAREQNVLFGGRLGQYRYYDMDKVIEAALDMAEGNLILFHEVLAESRRIYEKNGVGDEMSEIMPVLEDGDILITFNSHFLGWRNGHAAIVTDAEAGLVLEALALGKDSAVLSLKGWRDCPSFAVLRLAGVSAEQRKMVAKYAEEVLSGVPYRLTAGMWESIETMRLSGTHCAHLVWYAYKQFGYDLDSDGGILVTPRDLYDSPLLELVQVYGMEP